MYLLMEKGRQLQRDLPKLLGSTPFLGYDSESGTNIPEQVWVQLEGFFGNHPSMIKKTSRWALWGWIDLGSRACASTCTQLPAEGETSTLGGVGCGCSLAAECRGLNHHNKIRFTGMDSFMVATWHPYFDGLLKPKNIKKQTTDLECWTAYLGVHSTQ